VCSFKYTYHTQKGLAMTKLSDYHALMNKIDETEYFFVQKIKDCSWKEYRLMAAIESAPDFFLQDFAAQRHRTSPAIGRLASGLVDRNLVNIFPRLDDQRYRSLRLTKPGANLLKRCHAVVETLLGKKSGR
jgi:DNA-binding MarR family transcriptional regulator